VEAKYYALFAILAGVVLCVIGADQERKKASVAGGIGILLVIPGFLFVFAGLFTFACLGFKAWWAAM
jgi:hypothetical protein